MRFREIQKIKNEKFLNKKYSDFELKEFATEIEDYKAILSSIGFDEGIIRERKESDKDKRKNVKSKRKKKKE